jgi:hypothetical protein
MHKHGLQCEDIVIRIIRNICISLSSKEVEDLLTQYDGICGDGDCGIVISKGALAVLQRVENNEYTHCAELCDDLANTISESMGGTSGALLEIMLRAMVAYFTNEVLFYHLLCTCVLIICE